MARRVKRSTPRLLDWERRRCFLATPPSRPIYLCIALSRHYVVTHTCDFQSETHQDAVCGRALSDDTAASVPSFFCPFTINSLDVTDYLVWMTEF